ncbi:MAG: DUF1028 domain-containing protein [Calditrichaeota bacterium]|nr:MAG: DUF1028 domain-containing protein [Calditrichota bacterium]
MRCFALVGFLFLFSSLMGQSLYLQPFAHTYSIVAVDSVTGEIGAAVQSHWFSVGSVVTWAEAGVGAVATQSLVNVSFGPRGLELLKQGKSPQEALDILIAGDSGRDYRQVAIIDARGNTATYTGAKCIPEAGHLHGKYYSVQANLMLKNTVWGAMKKAFLSTSGPLAERLVAALEAAQAEGGDIRGQQSAALVVVRGEATGNIWEDRLIDLRVEDHPEPVKELKRLLKVYRAYEHMNAGDVAMEHSDVEGALREYGAAMKMMPENLEMKYWTAVSLANAGRVDEALELFRAVFARNANWKTLTPRLVPIQLLNVSPETLQKIMELP